MGANEGQLKELQKNGEMNKSSSIVAIYTYRPVVVEMAQFVGEPLHLVRTQAHCIPHNVVVRWRHCALAYTLRYQEEVIPATSHTLQCFQLVKP